MWAGKYSPPTLIPNFPSREGETGGLLQGEEAWAILQEDWARLARAAADKSLSRDEVSLITLQDVLQTRSYHARGGVIGAVRRQMWHPVDF